MPAHIDTNDPKCAGAAAEILRRHDNAEPEANITSAVRDFLIATGLVKSSEIVEENPPAQGSRCAVDLTALDTFIEFKRRIGTTGGFNPDPENVRQLDEYLAQSQRQNRVRMGILTDGKYWLLRWPNAGPVRATPPYAFTLEGPDRWITLYEWLRDHALSAEENQQPSRLTIAERFGPISPSYQRDIAALNTLYDQCANSSTVKIKRQLWQNLLAAALGEIASSPTQLDDLFVRHTYLTAVIGMVVQASFGSDIYRLAETDPTDLLNGRDFRSKTGLQGVVESDFFAWPTEVEGGLPLIKTLARRVAKFDWQKSPNDVAAILYETVIPPDERRQLGEYYTPDWLARTIVREVVTDPLEQVVLDPACGSGTFVAEAVTHFIEAANRTSLDPQEALEWLRFSIVGIDVHPVAVHLARAAWVLAAQPAIQTAVEDGFAANVTVPIYLGDALQLRFRTGDLFAQHNVTVQVEDEQNTELVFPVSLVEERAETFDALMGDIAEAIENGDDPHLALDDHHISAPAERQTLENTIAAMQRLHSEGRNHIWAYYTRNLVRPVALSRSKVDVIIGNPPWLNYNQAVSTLRTELERQSRNVYGIWAGGRYATHQDVAGLFFARSVDLYLKDGGMIGMVLPHSALQTGQHSKWRTGAWRAKPSGKGRDRTSGRVLSVDFGHKTAWDLEGLEPNTFFPVPASVVFARRIGEGGKATPLAGEVERWLGNAGAADVRRVSAGITDTSVGGDSPYASRSRQGSTVVPRCLFFVEETENLAIVRAGQTVTVNPRRGSQDKEPWRSLDLAAITGQTIEKTHLFNVHLGETLAPYVTLTPLKAVLPLRRGDGEIPAEENGVGGIRIGGLERRMRERWRTISSLWEGNKAAANKLDLLGRLDYLRELSAQLEWQQNPGDRPVRVVYSGSGAPTAASLQGDDVLVDYTLFWILCKDVQEAHYLLAIINSDALCETVTPLMPKGQFGARHLQKHLWRLPIPEFDPSQPLHVVVAEAGEAAAEGAVQQLDKLRQERDRVTVTIARRELRKWLRESVEGKAVEAAVSGLLTS